MDVRGGGKEVYKVPPVYSKVGGVPGGGMPGQGKTPGNIEGAFHVSTMEVEGVHFAGGAGTVAAM